MNEKLRREFDDALMSTGRTGVAGLIDYLDQAGFYTAPCSGAYHLACEGGLLEHSLNVLTIALEMNHALQAMLPEDSIILAALLHDAGKVGRYGKSNYEPNILKNGKQSAAKPYTTNKNLLYIDHAIRSTQIVESFITLKEDEEFAIMYHNGLYTKIGYDLSGHETPLQMIIHWADMWASRVVEAEEEEGEE